MTTPYQVVLPEQIEQGGSQEEEEETKPTECRQWLPLGLSAVVLVGGLLCLAISGSREQAATAGTPVAPGPAEGEGAAAGPVCEGCASPWDAEKVTRLCAGRSGAEERRLGGNADDIASISHYAIGKGRRGNLMYYGSQELSLPKIAAKSMVLFIHGAARNAQDYFCTLQKIITESNLLNEETLIVVPKFSYYSDGHASTDCFWNGTRPGGDWRAGGMTDPRSPCNMSSFELFDDILRIASDREKLPLLEGVVVMGFSAGGQTVQRYSLVSDMIPPALSSIQAALDGTGIHPALRVRYIVGNPSSYAYLDNNRWIYDCGTEAVPTGCTEMVYAPYDREHGRRGWDSDTGFAAVATASPERPFLCADSGFNEWNYGIDWDDLDGPETVPFLRQHPDLNRSVHEWYPHRQVVYLIGTRDTCTGKVLPFCFDTCWKKDDERSPCSSTILDTRCPAMLQGPNRHQRAHNYMKHLAHFYGLVQEDQYIGCLKFQAWAIRRRSRCCSPLT